LNQNPRRRRAPWLWRAASWDFSNQHKHPLVVPSSAKFIAACDDPLRGWHGQSSRGSQAHAPTPSRCLRCPVRDAPSPAHRATRTRQNPNGALSVLHLVRPSRSHLSGPIQRNESCAIGIPERLLLALLYGPAVRCKLDLMIWRRLVLRFCIRPLNGGFVLLAIMDIRAQPISF